MLKDFEIFNSIEKDIEKHLKNEKKTIYVLKGFGEANFSNYSMEKLYSVDLDNIDDYSFKKQLVESMTKLQSEKSFVLSYEEFVVGQKFLSNIYSMYEYEIHVIENNVFINYYPLGNAYNVDDVQKALEKEDDDKYGLYYDELLKIESEYFVSYKPIEVEAKIRYISLVSDNKDKNFVSSIENAETITFGNCEETMLETLVQILKSSNRNYNIIKDNSEYDQSKYVLNALTKYGYNFGVQSKEIKYDLPKNYELYEDILKRKNPNYKFKNITFYTNPGFELNTVDINQSVIIDSLVTNALKANNNEKYNDIFVTAPTGSGKSILFQIPAIYLGETKNLFTLVVSPLIGLMEDQVSNIESMTNRAATINSDYTPQDKDEIKEKIRNNKIDILYVSPETLLSNWDISNIIGEREIGLMIIDEAHIVSTWGKSFRPDYWFLGDYISTLRRKGERKFPIATFSATITYGGSDDMHADIIESLKMRTGNYEYIAPMRRDDISFDIKYYKDSADYLKEKDDLVVKDLDKLIKEKNKTIAYFPYTRQTSEFCNKLKDSSSASIYHGQLDKIIKQSDMLDFKNNKTTLMLATKAFGMGIDIDDIQTVYHYAPTGNLCDYVQEIGRAARREDIQGTAKLEFYEHDFRHIKRLYGMSAIRDYHIIGALRKIKSIYEEKGKRNFTVSSDEFSYIFTNSKDSDEVDAKLKTVLLMIQKDFERDNTINFKPIIFKPRSMFMVGYLMIKNEDYEILKRRFPKHLKYFKQFKRSNQMSSKFKQDKTYLDYNNKDSKGNYSIVKSTVTNTVKLLGDVYRVDYKSMWEDLYSDMSFGMFKHDFMEGKLKDFNISGNFIPEYLLNVTSEDGTIGEACDKVSDILTQFLYKMSEIDEDKHISLDDIGDIIKSIKGIKLKNTECTIAAESIVNIINKYNAKQTFFKQNIFKQHEDTKKYNAPSYAKISNRIKEIQKGLQEHFKRSWNQDERSFLINTKNGKVSNSEQMLLSQLLQVFKLATYDVVSGDVPEYFIRVNSVSAIDRILNKPNYHSEMVQLVRNRHEESIKIMRYFFTKLDDDKDRWDYIEKYFAGFKQEVAETEELDQ